MSMIGIAIVVMVQAESGSFGVAGSVAAANLSGNALFAIPVAAAIDRLGQSRVLPALVLLWSLGLIGLIWCSHAEWGTVPSCGFAAVAGATLPPIGSCIRARWAAVLADTSKLQTSFALETTIDEIVFVGGPVLVTTLVVVSPAAGLAAAIVLGVAGTAWLSTQTATQPRARSAARRSSPVSRMPWMTLIPLVISWAGLGLLLSTAEVATVAYATDRHDQALAGILLGVWAAGSLVAGVVIGAVTSARSPVVLFRLGSLAMAGTIAPTPFVSNVAALAAVLFLAGFALAPTLIASTTLVERLVPPSRLTEGLAVVQSGMLFGLAVGPAVGGLLIDSHGADGAYFAALVGGALAAAVALVIPGGTPSPDLCPQALIGPT
jgi:hypothetical protein